MRKDLGVLDEKLDATLATELQEFKQFLQPFRLSIMQLVYVNSKITSVKVKDDLELSWNEYYGTIPSLEKSGFIKISEDFDKNGSKRQFIEITGYGRVEYIRMIKIIEKFMERAKEIIPGYNSDILYPRS